MTIRSDATRLIESSSSAVFSDGGLSNLCRDLKDIYEVSSEEDAVSNVRTHLQTTYGSQNVIESVHPVEYEWVWDPVTGTWVKRKKTGSTFSIDDGEDHSLQAYVLVLQPIA